MNETVKLSGYDAYLWMVYGNASAVFPWNQYLGGGGFFESQWLTISHQPQIRAGLIPTVELSGQTPYTDPRAADAVTVDISGKYSMSLDDVEYVDSSLDTNSHLRLFSHFGFTTDGSLDAIDMNIGNHDLHFTTAIKNSTLHMGAGWDKLHLVDHLDLPGEQYWSLISREFGQVDAYSLVTGNRVRLQGGGAARTDDSGRTNYGEVEDIFLNDARTGTVKKYQPGKTGTLDDDGDMGENANIDLRSDGQTHSDSFNLAYFNFIRYTSDNVWVGEATVHDGTDYSTPSDRRVVTEKSGYDHAAPILEGQLSVIGESRNGTHDLFVEEQASGEAIDGKFRLYAFDVESELYNEFNEVFLGTSDSETSNKSTIVGSDWSDRVALYGFGGEDVLKGGNGRDYIFGGQSDYNQLNAGEIGNQVTGGEGADYFGVGNTTGDGTVSGSNTTIAAGKGDFHQGYATDVIMDWHANEDTLVVLSNGVAVIGGLRDNAFGGIVSLDIANVIDLRDYAATATSDQDFDGPRGGDNWDATKSLADIYADQSDRDDQSITNEGDRTVVNEGLIVARGLGGSDIIHGSPGDDYLYGNKASNSIRIGNGGNDRVYYDTFDGSASKHFVTGFTVANSGANAAEADKFFVNKRVIDAFSGSDPNRDLIASDANGSYVSAVKYNSGFNFLHSSFYNPGYAVDNNTHKKEDGRGLYDFDVFELVDEPALPPGPSGSDGDSSLVGLGFYVAAKIAYAIPFVGPAIAAGLTASAKLLGGAGGIVVTTPHQNATYSGDVGNYLNILTGAGLREPNTAGDTTLDTSVKFLDFFPSVDAGDGFLPVVEFTANAGESIYGYFAMHSSDHTFVYLVASRDNLVENSEAILVAQVEGHLKAEDFGVYDGDEDIYNYKKDGEPAVVILEPRIDTVSDSNTSPDFGFDRGEDTANPANDLLIIAPSDAAKAKIEVTGIIEGTPNTGSSYVVYDGGTVVFDTARPGDFSGASFNTKPSGSDTTFTFIDGRPLGTVAVLDQDENEYGDGNWTLTDTRVTYTVELKDGTTGIATRGSVSTVTVEGGLTTIDGGNGEDTLTVTKTSGFLNSADDDQIVNFQNFVLVASGNEGVELDLQKQDEGFTISASNNGDTITGGSVGANNFVGGAGNDLITGGAGNDTFNGFTADDTMDGAGGVNTLRIFGTNNDLNNLTISAASDDKIQNVQVVELTIAERQPEFQVELDENNTVSFVRVLDPGDGLADNGSQSYSIVNGGATLTVEFEVINGSVDIPTQSVTNGDVTTSRDATLPFTVGSGTHTDAIYTLQTPLSVAGFGGRVDLKSQSDGFTILGSEYDDTLVGSSGNDSIVGGDGNDTIVGGTGNDTIVGGGGAESIDAGDGDDVVIFSSASALSGVTTVIGGNDTDTLRFDTGVPLVDTNFAKVIEFERLELTGSNIVTLGTDANTAGLAFVKIGSGTTSVIKTHASALTIDAEDLANNTSLTINDHGVTSNFTVNNLVGDLDALGVAGTLIVDLDDNQADGTINVEIGIGDTTVSGGAAGDTVFVTMTDAAQPADGTIQIVDLSNNQSNFVVDLGGGRQTAKLGVGVHTIDTGAGDTTGFDRIELTTVGSATADIDLSGSDADVAARITSIENYNEDVIDFQGDDALGANLSIGAFTTGTNGFVTNFGGADTTLVDKITSVRTALDQDTTLADNPVVGFVHNGDTYAYGRGTSAVDDDQIVRIVGDDALNAITIGTSFVLKVMPNIQTITTVTSLLPYEESALPTQTITPNPAAGLDLSSQSSKALWTLTGGDTGTTAQRFGKAVTFPTSTVRDDSSATFNLSGSNSNWGYADSLWTTGVNFFSADSSSYYNTVHMGTNGYITFGKGYSGYVPSGIAGFTRSPIIAGQFDDLYAGTPTRNVNKNNFEIVGPNSTGDGILYFHQDANKMVFTWNNVGLFSNGVSSTNTNSSDAGSAFQVILHKKAAANDFGIEIRYEEVTQQYATATAGWSAGDTINYGLINEGSTKVWSTATGAGLSNTGIDGVWAWNVTGGRVSEGGGSYLPDVGVTHGKSGSGTLDVAQLTVSGLSTDNISLAIAGEVVSGQFGYTHSTGSTEATIFLNYDPSTPWLSEFNLWKDQFVDGKVTLDVTPSSTNGTGQLATVEFV